MFSRLLPVELDNDLYFVWRLTVCEHLPYTCISYWIVTLLRHLTSGRRVIGTCKWSSDTGEQPSKLQRTTTHNLQEHLYSLTMRTHHRAIDGRPCGMASEDGFRLLTAGLLP